LRRLKMTPLAQRIVKDLTVPIKDRKFNDRDGLLPRMADVHCFECTEIMDLAGELKVKIAEGGIDERSTFLPAPKTWLEWRDDRGRIGVLLVEDEDGMTAENYWAFDGYGDFGGYRHPTKLPLRYSPSGSTDVAELYGSDEEVLALLAIINTPKVVGRKQHMPHRGLQKRLINAKGLSGSFPLRAWTEIKLNISPPVDMTDSSEAEAHLTGKKALHFCRAHLRVRLGRIEVVRSHWRGDASIGIKQSRYKVTH
jgi:hypothetical protein